VVTPFAKIRNFDIETLLMSFSFKNI